LGQNAVHGLSHELVPVPDRHNHGNAGLAHGWRNVSGNGWFTFWRRSKIAGKHLQKTLIARQLDCAAAPNYLPLPVTPSQNVRQKPTMKIALLTTDNREHSHDYRQTEPCFGSALRATVEHFQSPEK
jgi:hypothetical protein